MSETSKRVLKAWPDGLRANEREITLAREVEDLEAEVERLRACMAKAGLAAFRRNGDPEAVAEHLRSVIDSYEKPAAECSRLQERVRALEAALRWYADEANYDEDHAPGEMEAEVPRYESERGWDADCGAKARAALEGIEVE